MYGSIDYLTKKATFKQVSDRVPVTQEIPDAEDPATFEGVSVSLFLSSDGLMTLPDTLAMRNTANKKQLVEDLLIKAKQMELLIDSLPAAKEFETAPSASTDKANGTGESAAGTAEPNADDTDEDLISLEKEMQQVNEQYLTALQEAGMSSSSRRMPGFLRELTRGCAAEELQKDLKGTMRSMLDEHHSLTSSLLSAHVG